MNNKINSIESIRTIEPIAQSLGLSQSLALSRSSKYECCSASLAEILWVGFRATILVTRSSASFVKVGKKAAGDYERNFGKEGL